MIRVENQILIDFNVTYTAESVSYAKAQLFSKIIKLKVELEKKRQTANFLYGRKRGVWRRATMADEKRSWKIQQLADQVRYLESQFNEML